jgi:hypothetical protein
MANKPTIKYEDILLELITLRETDYDAFMFRLYDALAGEYRSIALDKSSVSEKREAISSMIKYFETKEQYEKCADLKKLVEEIKEKP